MRILIALFLSLLFLTNNQINDRRYSITRFINYLIRINIYDILYDIKCNIGVDVAIEFCEIFTLDPQCEETIKVYISDCEEKKLDYCSGEGREKFVNLLYDNLKIEDFKLKPEQISEKISNKLCGSKY